MSSTPKAPQISSEERGDYPMTMKKAELIEELLNAVRVKANQMRVEELQKLRGGHEWISKVRRRRKTNDC